MEDKKMKKGEMVMESETAMGNKETVEDRRKRRSKMMTTSYSTKLSHHNADSLAI